MNRLAKNRGAQTLVLLAFLAFFAHSLKICGFRFERCAACRRAASCAEPNESANRAAPQTVASADSPLFCASDCDEPRGDACFLTFSPIKKTDSRLIFAALADAFAPSPISAPPIPTPRRFDFNEKTVYPDAVPLYLRWETLLI